MLDPDNEDWLTSATGSIGQGMDPEAVWRQFAEALGQDRVDLIRAEYERRIGVIRTLKEPAALIDRGIRDWYPGPLPAHRFWPSLEQYLTNVKVWPQDVVSSIDDASTKVVSLLQPPGRASFKTRGLVLGHVQSGKTANFTAVISKAADVGYRLFIVLSGMTNALRAQTQRRLNRELVDLQPSYWFTLTDPESDFRALAGVKANAVLTDKSHLRLLAVVKKNAFILNRLRKWLDSANREVIQNCPVLVIDDEADQAGLNAAKYREERTRINSLILEILGLLTKHGYVGYTATPFANVLVDPEVPEDLYPRDFIVDLERPNDYFGPEKIFGRSQLTYAEDDEPDDGLDMIRTVEEAEIPHLRPRGAQDRFDFLPAITSSLESAIRYFWLATAARRARGQIDDHSTMLIHTSLYVSVHNVFKPLLEDFQGEILRRFQVEPAAERALFAQLWTEEGRTVPSDPAEGNTLFAELEPFLLKAIVDTAIVVDNNQTEYRLDFSDENRVRIVVGGNTLSRGLTLEGLVVSFFVRSSGAYDTLLQMGRWFGYRKGYADLPRIWMTDELAGYFRDLALVEAEIRNDIQKYEKYGLTPAELALRIRVHPSLQVTSRLKMQAADDVQLSYSGQRPQTILFDHRSKEALEANLSAGRNLLRRVQDSGIKAEVLSQGRYRVLRNIPAEPVLQFFTEYRFHPENQTMRPDLLSDYVREQQRRGGLVSWTVAVIGKRRGPNVKTIDLGLDEDVPLIERAKLKEPERPYAYLGAIMSDDDRFLDFPKGERRPSTHGLLLLYPIDKDSTPRPVKGTVKRTALDAVAHVLGVGVVFPEADHDTPRYVAVQLPLFDPDSIDEPEDLPAETDEDSEVEAL